MCAKKQTTESGAIIGSALNFHEEIRTISIQGCFYEKVNIYESGITMRSKGVFDIFWQARIDAGLYAKAF